jgi:hypothetical protein
MIGADHRRDFVAGSHVCHSSSWLFDWVVSLHLDRIQSMLMFVRRVRLVKYVKFRFVKNQLTASSINIGSICSAHHDCNFRNVFFKLTCTSICGNCVPNVFMSKSVKLYFDRQTSSYVSRMQLKVYQVISGFVLKIKMFYIILINAA